MRVLAVKEWIDKHVVIDHDGKSITAPIRILTRL